MMFTTLNANLRYLALVSLLAVSWSTANAVTDSDIVTDPPTLHSLGFFVPYSGGQVSLEYRVQGTNIYSQALGMLEVNQGQFAGSILNLQSGTNYEVKFTFDGSTVINKVVNTLGEPLQNPQNQSLVVIPDDKDLNTALNEAQPGEVLYIKNGTYSGPFVISNSGTKDNPIILRGESLGGVILESPERSAFTQDDFLNVCYQGGTNLRIEGSHIYVENMTLRGEYWGVTIESNVVNEMEGIVIRNTKISNVFCGIRANDNAHRNHFFGSNTIEGKLVNADTGRKTWNIDGISITGQGHTISQNTLSGFGDTIDIPPASGNRAIDIFANDILFSGDDALEMDGGERNIRVFKNRVSNSGSGISVQPGGGGPFYFYRNIIYNTGLVYDEGGTMLEAYLPFKFKDGASGLYIFHNTTIRPGNAWQQGESIINSQMFNNLVLGTTGGASFGISSDSQVDYNGFNRNSPYGNNGVQLSLPIFASPDPILASGDTDWTLYYTPPGLELDPQSIAVDSGKTLNNINDNFTGTAPDLGALEMGQSVPNYGVLPSDSTAPSTVTGVSATGISATVVQLTWSAATDNESGISGYVIYRDGVRLTTVTGTSYQDTGLAEDNSYSYQIAAINGASLEGARNTAVSVSTQADNVSPTLVSVTAEGASTQVVVTFSEPVSSASAQVPSNYTIDNGVMVSAATLDADEKKVRLNTTFLSVGVTYRLAVDNIADKAATPNVISSGSGLSFEHIAGPEVSGTVPSTYLWGTLAVSELVYVDRAYVYNAVPSMYAGMSNLRTANGDKFGSGAASVSFSLSQAGLVYIGYDIRNTTLPSWLQNWTDTGDELTTSDGRLRLYSKSFTAGSVSLGGNEMGNSMYVVLISNDNNNQGGGTNNSLETPAANNGSGGGGINLLELYFLILLVLGRFIYNRAQLKI